MALSDIAKAASTADPLPWRTCAVCHALATIPADEAQGLRDLLRGKLRYSDIRDLIAQDADTPLQLDVDALSRHARGRCAAREVLRTSAA
jgi:hypothetical protein